MINFDLTEEHALLERSVMRAEISIGRCR